MPSNLPTPTLPQPSVLFVDDEPGIRATLPRILEHNGFQVTTCASVPEALSAIQNATAFDILLTDLNIGEPGDGFTVVSAMRRQHPETVTILLTGFPDFSTALQAIRNQVDDYVTKPADIAGLVKLLKDKLDHRSPGLHPHMEVKPVAQIISENILAIIENWYSRSEASPMFHKIPLSRKERIDHLPKKLSELVEMLESRKKETTTKQLHGAYEHGKTRRRQGYSAEMIVEETRLLDNCIFDLLQQHLLSIDISTLIPDIVSTADTSQVQLGESMRAWSGQQPTPVPA